MKMEPRAFQARRIPALLGAPRLSSERICLLLLAVLKTRP